MTFAAVEIGGTKVLVTGGTDPGDHPPPVRLATGAPEPTLAGVVAAVEAVAEAAQAEGSPLEAIGVASFGPVQLDRGAADYGHMLDTPKPGWAGANLLAPLRRFGVPIVLDTDVNAAALGEGGWGAARGVADHAYITVGTGVGVGVVCNGRPVHGAAHPEGGHLRVRLHPGDAFAGACAWHGACVEGMLSGPALQARFGRPGSEIAADDPIWAFNGDYLAQLCAALVLLTAPRRIVVGGGVGKRPELIAATRASLLGQLNGYLGRLSTPEAIAELVVPAALEDAALAGALSLARDAARG